MKITNNDKLIIVHLEKGDESSEIFEFIKQAIYRDLIVHEDKIKIAQMMLNYMT